MRWSLPGSLTALNAGLLASVCSALLCGTVQAQDKVLNLYSARHYQTDQALYDKFTRTTGIQINRVDADDAGLLAKVAPEIDHTSLMPFCGCCTHTFNGQLFSKPYIADPA